MLNSTINNTSARQTRILCHFSKLNISCKTVAANSNWRDNHSGLAKYCWQMRKWDKPYATLSQTCKPTPVLPCKLTQKHCSLACHFGLNQSKFSILKNIFIYLINYSFWGGCFRWFIRVMLVVSSIMWPFASPRQGCISSCLRMHKIAGPRDVGILCCTAFMQSSPFSHADTLHYCHMHHSTYKQKPSVLKQRNKQ